MSAERAEGEMDVEEKKTFIEDLLSGMSVEQKVGQCLVLGFVSTIITPETIRKIREYHPAGLAGGLKWRIRTAVHDPGGTNVEYARTRMIRLMKGTNRDFLTDIPCPFFRNEEYCEVINRLKKASIESNNGICLYLSFDDEGDQSAEYYRDGYRFMPTYWGITQLGDKQFAHDVPWAVARQTLPLGFDWTYSMCVDVNTNPMNPEIGTRSWSDDPDVVIEMSLRALQGYRDAGMICSGKHFPGRGASVADSHRGLPVIDISKEELSSVHLAPYRELFKAGLPSVMTAHTLYPQIDPDYPATLSRKITTGILKEELGFEGCVILDEITMGGIIERFDVPEACILAINAGGDQILFRDEGGIIDEAFPALVRAVEDGTIAEERINDAVRRTLSVKYDYGFFEGDRTVRDPGKASEGIRDPEVERISIESGNRSVRVIRDEADLLPLPGDRFILLVEQVNPLHEFTNIQQCHPSLLWEKCLEHSDNVGVVECTLHYVEADRERVRARRDEADMFIVTNYYNRRVGYGNEFVKEIHGWGKPVVVVTNAPFPFTVLPEYKTVIINYSSSPESYAETARRLFGS
ncbi:MAG: glycoside hydrolase family 3 N-terminal domain-containing protein [Kiritimatiellia bacterium]